MERVIKHIRVMVIRGRTFDFSHRTYLMGILNVTPDSFSDGGKYLHVDDAVAHALHMAEEGADIIDVGGESTRPKGVYGEGAKKISAEEEIERVVPVIKKIRMVSDIPISIDTYKSVVADEALKAGADIVNDISGLRFDPTIATVAARHRAPMVVMHIQGTPETMQLNPTYDNVVAEVKEEVRLSAEKAKEAGVETIIVDPGIGFGKNLQHNLLLLKHLREFCDLGYPLLVGTSRKGFIGTLLNLPVNQRLEGTAASVAVAILNGANIVRVHDVKEMKRVVTIVDAVKNA